MFPTCHADSSKWFTDLYSVAAEISAHHKLVTQNTSLISATFHRFKFHPVSPFRPIVSWLTNRPFSRTVSTGKNLRTLSTCVLSFLIAGSDFNDSRK